MHPPHHWMSAGRRRSPATCLTSPGAAPHATRACGIRQIRHRWRRSSRSCAPAAMTLEGVRLRGLIVVLWRAGLRISEALALAESDLDPSRGAILVRHGKGGSAARSAWTAGRWEQLDPWLQLRRASFRSGRCSAWCEGRRAVARGQPAGVRVPAAPSRRTGWHAASVRAASAAPRPGG